MNPADLQKRAEEADRQALIFAGVDPDAKDPPVKLVTMANGSRIWGFAPRLLDKIQASHDQREAEEQSNVQETT